MYHDQALPVIKSMGFGIHLISPRAAIHKISVDHGTAFDLAGKNIADFSSMNEALKTSMKFL